MTTKPLITTDEEAIGPRRLCRHCRGTGTVGRNDTRCFACGETGLESIKAERCNELGPYPAGCHAPIGHQDGHHWAF